MIRIQYRDFTTVANFAHSTEAGLELLIRDHANKYGAITMEEIEIEDLEFEDLLED
jgi:hypothetical protein